MAHSIVIVDWIFAVRWSAVPDSVEIEQVLAEIVRTRRALGRKLLYVALIPEHVDVPTGVQRHALAKFGERATPYVDESHLVFEGGGFWLALQRSVVTALYTLRGGAVKVRCYKSIEEVAPSLAASTGRAPGAILRALRGEAESPTRAAG